MPLGSSIRRHLLTGALVIVPVSVTLWLIFVIARFVVNALHLAIFPVGLIQTFITDPWLARLMRAVFEFGNFLAGLLITFGILMVVGATVRTFVGKKLMGYWEGVIDRIPFVRGVYGAVKQLTEAIFLTGEKSFSRVALVEYPRRDCYCIGFVTGDAPSLVYGVIPHNEGVKMINVFIPSTPNPTTGYYLVMPEKDIMPIDMSVEDAFRLIISGGLAIGSDIQPK